MNFLITFVKTFFMNLCIAFSYMKIKGCKKKNIISLVITDNIISILYAMMCEKIEFPLQAIFVNTICYIIYLIIFAIIVDELDGNFFIGLLFSTFLTFTSLLVSGTVFFYITRLRLFDSIINTIVEYMLIGIVQFIIVLCFFKIRRFKDGFSFIKEDNFHRKINRTCIILSIVIIIVIIFTTSKSRFVDKLTLFMVVFGIILVLYLIKNKITNYYKSKMKDRTVETLTEQLKEKDQTIENLKSELSKTLKINHKYNHRISAMEKAVSKLEFNEEFASEHGDIIALVKELSENYKSELLPADNQEIIQKTNVFAIDNMLEYMATKASKSNIALKVEVKCDVKDMTENIIDKNKLETLLADHINDAIIAIQHCIEKSGKILVKFEIHSGIYEVKIYDTGIEFEINTLLQLGKHQVTTHKDSGGSGIGFMTTFETLRAYKGSLIIEEYNNQTTDYTKAIVARFDNNNEYKICSYRSDEIKIEAEKQEKYDNMENIMPLLAVAKGKQEK